jgi:hypothetical protein
MRPERVPKCVPFAFHLCSIRIPIAFHVRSTFTGTHLRNAFPLHSYRNRTSSEIIAISRVLVSFTFTFCPYTIKHQTAFIYLISSNGSRIKITYEQITYVYCMWSILPDKTKHSQLISSIRYQLYTLYFTLFILYLEMVNTLQLCAELPIILTIKKY